MHSLLRALVIIVMGLVYGASSAIAQATGSLELLVRESGTARPLTDATVRIIATGQFTFTDATGHALLLEVPVGRYSVEVRHLGHARRVLDLDFSAGRVTQVQMTLEIDPFELEHIEVRGVRSNPRLRRAGFYHRERSHNFGTFIGEEEIDRRRQTTNRLSDLLYGVRGLSIVHEYGVPIIVAPRGARNCRPSIYIDGIRIGTSPDRFVATAASASPEYRQFGSCQRHSGGGGLHGHRHPPSRVRDGRGVWRRGDLDQGRCLSFTCSQILLASVRRARR